MVAVVGQPSQIVASGECGHIQCLQREDVCSQSRRDVESDDAAREHVSNERDVGEALPRSNVGDSTTQSRRGVAAVKRRFTRSSGFSPAGSDLVVNTRLLRLTPRKPGDCMILPV